MVNAQDIYHKLQVDDCESLGHEASGEVFQFLKKKKKKKLSQWGGRACLGEATGSRSQSQRKGMTRQVQGKGNSEPDEVGEGNTLARPFYSIIITLVIF